MLVAAWLAASIVYRSMVPEVPQVVGTWKFLKLLLISEL